ncbi:LAMI_0G17700g1_1 [Lachancea mirantina]|uniref:D-lactate dehydratase n=1 Tax=Lachancea mirantina TaxID=1230905 RepID=A0A1G4KCX1_9SACH|nr:LAMI_0G17700g1_1 [Lachancea mirantina]
MAAKKALIAISSYNDVFYSDGAKTGVFVVEAMHPYDAFTEKGIEVDFVSESGTFGYDEHSLASDFLNGKDLKAYEDKSSGFCKGINSVKKPNEVNAEDYSIFFASAGHATLFDYPTAKGLQDLASKIYQNGGVVAAVCHGPAIFENLKDLDTGKYLIEGKVITGFTNIGEVMLKVDDIMRQKSLKSVEDIAKLRGAKYLAPIGPWDDYSITDGRLVTGVNPASAHSTAVRAMEAVKGFQV